MSTRPCEQCSTEIDLAADHGALTPDGILCGRCRGQPTGLQRAMQMIAMVLLGLLFVGFIAVVAWVLPSALRALG